MPSSPLSFAANFGPFLAEWIGVDLAGGAPSNLISR